MTTHSDSNLRTRFPSVHAWVFGGGWIEIGEEVRHGSLARALDEGGQVWEGKRKYNSLEDALKDLDRGIAKWLKKHGCSHSRHRLTTAMVAVQGAEAPAPPGLRSQPP